MRSYFDTIAPIRYEGPESDNPLAFRWYDPQRIVLGKPMRDQLRFAVCYWHSFVWQGQDPFGGETFERPWFDAAGKDPMQQALRKLDHAFEFFSKLGVPYFCFHDRDIAPEGSTPSRSRANLLAVGEVMKQRMSESGVKLLWGTANLFGHRRYMAGAASNPDPAIFAFAAAQVREVLDLTQALGGENYVLWGGREGYETLLNTDLKQELDQLARFMSLVVDHKHKIGFKGAILIEPKPKEPSKHQYDFDAQTVHAFLQRYGLQNEIKLNIEANHATLAGHSFEHDIAMASAAGILGSIDMNRGDELLGWDTDQFPNNVPQLALAFYHIYKGGGLTTGGLNFDAKLRRQSIDAEDLFIGHIGAMDCCARALLAAEAMIRDGRFERQIARRYQAWREPRGISIMQGKVSLAELANQVLDADIEPLPVSGKQELLENWVNRFV